LKTDQALLVSIFCGPGRKGRVFDFLNVHKSKESQYRGTVVVVVVVSSSSAAAAAAATTTATATSNKLGLDHIGLDWIGPDFHLRNKYIIYYYYNII
tara:strand:+ start:192 stop:482 length:291 start_codon:yes stop_codon:yes gene_type:complete